jgi:RNA polymerase primary sigma factor
MKNFRLHQKMNNRLLVSNSFNRYLDEVRSTEVLSPDEEFEIALKATNPNLSELEREEALMILVNKNLRFVISVAKQYVSVENSLEDLINEGNHGLIRAARKFDPTKGFRFITFAVWWIRADMLSFIAKNARSVKLPINKLSMISKIRQKACLMEQILERQPNINELMEYCGGEYTKEQIEFYFEHETENSYSLDKQISDNENNSYSRIELLEDNVYGRADDNINNEDTIALVDKLLSNIKDDRNKEVFIYLFGLNGNKVHSIREVAEKMNLSKEGVRQIKQKNLIKLKKIMTIY